MVTKSDIKIILLDIETLPIMSEVMKVFPGLSAYPGLTLKASLCSIICFGYQIWGSNETHVINAWDAKKAWAKDINDDLYVVKQIHKVLEDADAIVTHNGKRFDWKFMQTRMLYHGLPPLKKVIHIDTCQEAKKNLLLFNNRLNTVSKFLTSEQKLENGGWDLWCKVALRDSASMELMTKYCAQDIITLGAVFKKLLPFVTALPDYNMVRYTEDFVCPRCSSTRIIKNGYGLNKTGHYIRFQCKDCGGYSSAKTDNKPPRAT